MSSIIAGMICQKIWGCLLSGILAVINCSAAESPPHVWIFAGLPGDAVHHMFFEKNLGSIKKSLIDRYGVDSQNLTILYGPTDAGYAGVCTREAMLVELEKIVAHGKRQGAPPVWIILHGHANEIPGGANLNLPGPDLSSTDLALALRDFPDSTPLTILAMTAASHQFFRVLGGPGRYMISGTSRKDPVSETDFPIALAATLSDAKSDTDGDGMLSLLELFLNCQQRIVLSYEKDGFIVREHSQIDGNGDGKGTQRPAKIDAEPASKVGLVIRKTSNFD